MRIGIISEGRSDQAVLTNIVKGALRISRSDVILLRPSLSKDATDKAFANTKTFGGWSYVMKDCKDRSTFDLFFSIDDQKIVILHLDSLQWEEMNKTKVRPDKKEANYSINLRLFMITQLLDWLDNAYEDRLLFAISIETMDAWVLTIYDSKNTTRAVDAKSKLDKLLRKTKLVRKEGDYDSYLKISSDFTDLKQLKSYSTLNESFYLFVESLIEFNENNPHADKL